MKIYADSSKLDQIINLYKTKKVSGFTTNPTLMKKAGVTNYLSFVKELTSLITDLPISFEIFADDYDTMREQIFKISNISNNIYVKVPVTNTKGNPSSPLIKEISDLGIKINVTAVFTQQQIDVLNKSLNPNTDSVISVFAGRIADTGISPIPIIKYAVANKISDKHQVLWASTREIYNVYEAEQAGCDIITVTPDVLEKLSLANKDLSEYSLETVKMFYDDAASAGYKL